MLILEILFLDDTFAEKLSSYSKYFSNLLGSVYSRADFPLKISCKLTPFPITCILSFDSGNCSINLFLCHFVKHTICVSLGWRSKSIPLLGNSSPLHHG